ncbi:peptidylprolyl isomerase [Jannaschia aquimarina]|uniref:Parvulin-like PPIase n=1 Tax=Jannaschia aquimarina TaxID=935700 RepID=A0A0D1D456_9RHOB|nr:peptidylprolyl isomerase [Jannaschia aquimarina]KIT14823.1 putative parvulin-type peptidyl-prolyl cis-trans isomerase precursor [Jannaschia aquimarina]SNS56943.1 peptidyl-prolyl cis-trans isomerase C [Jannaschia aquimarina]
MIRPLLLVGALAAPMPALAQDASTVLATVNGTDITLGHVIALRERLPAEYQQLPDDVLYQGLLDQLIQQQALNDVIGDDLNRADELSLENERRAFLASRMIGRLAEEPLDESAIEEAYKEQFGSAEPETEWNASHILVETEEEARALKAQADEGADFAELARENSTGPSGPNGGLLGWFGAGQMVPEFQQAVESLEAGQVSDPVQTQFGWHVVKLNETRQKDAPPLEQVRPQIENALRESTVQAEIERIAGEAQVERAEIDIEPSVIRDPELID